MSSESESLSCGVALDSKEGGEFRKDLRISYARELLLSLAELDACKKLPDGFDQSILSELVDAHDNALEHQIQSHETVPSGGLWGDPTQELITGRWQSSKLSSKDSNLTDSGRRNVNQYRPVRQYPDHSGILGSWSGSKSTEGGSEVSALTSQVKDHSLLSRCSEPYRPPSFYKEMNDLGRQKEDTLNNDTFGSAEGLSKERATEESWRKASFDLMRNEQLKAIQYNQKSSLDDQKENYHPDACAVLKESSSVPILNSYQSRSPVYPAASGSTDASCATRGTVKKYLKKESSNQPPLLQHPVLQQFPSKSLSVKLDSGVSCSADKLEGKILEGGRFSALVALGEAEDFDSDFVDKMNNQSPLNMAEPSESAGYLKANLASKKSSRDGQVASNLEFKFVKKKHLKTDVTSSFTSKENNPPGNTNGNTAIKPSANQISVISTTSFKPSYAASNLLEASLAQQKKGIDVAAKELHKGNTPLTSGPDDSAAKLPDGSRSEIWQSSSCAEHHDTITDGKGSCKSQSKFAHWFIDNDQVASSKITSWGDKNGNKVWGPSTGIAMKQNVLDQRQSISTQPFCAQKAPISKLPTKTNVVGKNCFPPKIGLDSHHPPQELLSDKLTMINQDLNLTSSREASSGIQITNGSKLNHHHPISNFGDEADSTLEIINLPDEDSLITIDDTFIFEQQLPKQPPAPKKQLQKSSYPRMQDSHVNSRRPFVIPSAPPTFENPWKQMYHHDYAPFPADVAPHPFGRLPLEPRNYESPPVQHFLSPRMQQADCFGPYFNNTFSAEPSTYCQLQQVPYCQPEPRSFGGHPLNYQRNVNSSSAMDFGKRGMLSEDKATLNQLLQMQMQLAQMNLDAAAGSEQRGYGKPISHQFW